MTVGNSVGNGGKKQAFFGGKFGGKSCGGFGGSSAVGFVSRSVFRHLGKRYLVFFAREVGVVGNQVGNGGKSGRRFPMFPSRQGASEMGNREVIE
jgi:hypothetical protein